MTQHPFGPIENQLIVGYYKRGFDPLKVKPVIKHSQRALVPNPDQELANRLIEPVFYGWSPANGNSSSHDFRVAYEYAFDAEKKDLLSRGLGYRITFTMPEQEINTDDPATYPKLKAWITDPFGEQELTELNLEGFEHSRGFLTFLLNGKKQLPLLRRLTIEVTPFKMEIREEKVRPKDRSVGCAIGFGPKEQRECNFPTYSPPDAPISSYGRELATRYFTLVGRLANSEDFEDRMTTEEVCDFIVAIEGVFSFIQSQESEGKDSDYILYERLEPALRFLFGICKQMEKVEPGLFTSDDEKFNLTKLEELAAKWISDQTEIPKFLTSCWMQFLLSKWKVLSKSEPDLAIKVHEIGVSLDFCPLSMNYSPLSGLLEEMIAYAFAKPINNKLPSMNQTITTNNFILQTDGMKWTTRVTISSLQCPKVEKELHLRPFGPANSALLTFNVVAKTDWLWIKFRSDEVPDRIECTYCLLNLEPLVSNLEAQPRSLQFVSVSDCVEADSLLLTSEFVGDSCIVDLTYGSIASTKTQILKVLRWNNSSVSTRNQIDWLSHNLVVPESESGREHDNLREPHIYFHKHSSRMFFAAVAISPDWDEFWGFLSCYRVSPNKIAVEATLRVATINDDMKWEVIWIETKRKYVYGLVFSAESQLTDIFAYHKNVFHRLQGLTRVVLQRWTSHQSQSRWIQFKQATRTVGLLRCSQLPNKDNNFQEYTVGQLYLQF